MHNFKCFWTKCCFSKLCSSGVFQDYPSLGLLTEKMTANNINLVFAVTNEVIPIYDVRKMDCLCHVINLLL